MQNFVLMGLFDWCLPRRIHEFLFL